MLTALQECKIRAAAGFVREARKGAASDWRKTVANCRATPIDCRATVCMMTPKRDLADFPQNYTSGRRARAAAERTARLPA